MAKNTDGLTKEEAIKMLKDLQEANTKQEERIKKLEEKLAETPPKPEDDDWF